MFGGFIKGDELQAAKPKVLHLCEIYVGKEDGVWCPQCLEFRGKLNILQDYHSA